MKKYKVVVIGDTENHSQNRPKLEYFQIFTGELKTFNQAYTITEENGKTHFFPINLTIIYEL
jgi:hypothetical protein